MILLLTFLFLQKIGFQISCRLSRDNGHEMSKPIFLENKKKSTTKCRLLILFPSMLSINHIFIGLLFQYTITVDDRGIYSLQRISNDVMK